MESEKSTVKELAFGKGLDTSQDSGRQKDECVGGANSLLSLSHDNRMSLFVPPPQSPPHTHSQRFCTGIKPSAHELWGAHPNHSHAQRKHAEQRLQDAPPHGSPLLLISGLLTSQPGCVWSSHYTVLTSYFWPETSHTISASCRREAGTPRWS